MEVEVPRRFVTIILVSLIFLALALIGLAVSPRDLNGHLLLLTPQRRAVLHYLRWCQRYADQLVRLQDDLDALTPDTDATDALPPAAFPDLYLQGQRAQKALDMSLALQREAERVHVPALMIGVHQRVTASAQAFTAWSEAVAAWVSAPTPQEAANLLARRQEARETLSQLLEVLGEPD